MIWKKLSDFILNNRLSILISIGVLTLLMAFEASKVRVTFNGGRVLPVTDSAFIRYNQFKKTFGQDASVMVLGIKSDQLFTKNVFNDWHSLADTIRKIKGISSVISIGNTYKLVKDTVQRHFELKPLIRNPLSSDQSADSIRQQIDNLPFYKGLVISNDGKSTLMAITFDNKIVNTPNRVPIIKRVFSLGSTFEEQHQIKVHYSGLPLIRTLAGDLITHEFGLFLSLSLAITALILIFFFRSAFAVIFPLIVVLLGVVWSLGLLYLAGYELTILTGMIPPLIVIIGVPNSIFILNKYYREYGTCGNKLLALHTVIQKVGITTFIANVTTAIGFGVLWFTNSQLLKEFGFIASLSVMFTFMLSLILIPIIFSFLPHPKSRQTGIKDGKTIQRVLVNVDRFVHNHRPAIYTVTIILVLICLYGMSTINVNGYVVDDLPKTSSIITDMRFFEKNFDGVLPLEVSIDTKRKNGLMNLSVIRKMDKMENLISSYPEFSRSISLTNALKFSTQAFYGGDKRYYRLPNELEAGFILKYAGNSGKESNIWHTYVDSTRRIARVTFEMFDVGSKKMNVILAGLQPRIDSIFNPQKFHVELTGSSIIFVKGTNYLVKNLYETLAYAIFLIAMVMWILFRGIKMIAISLLPNLIPLVITAGIMGFLGIPFKPSSILIFSIAMGISSDQTIYFLTRYRQELKGTNKSISEIVSDTIRETGISMIYIATVLFFGFGIFIASSFGGSVVFGILLSITLLVAMISNLTLLPAFLLTFEKRKSRSEVIAPPDMEAQDL
jgi:predicted RND superfamily exporter protein